MMNEWVVGTLLDHWMIWAFLAFLLARRLGCGCWLPRGSLRRAEEGRTKGLAPSGRRGSGAALTAPSRLGMAGAGTGPRGEHGASDAATPAETRPLTREGRIHEAMRRYVEGRITVEEYEAELDRAHGLR